jgi:tRNA threonylcarbamoyladenosine biosynthesis protein TsaE
MNGMNMELEYTLDSIDEVAKEIWQKARNYSIWIFSGDMGAGKTTLISAICRYLNVKEPVSSPTFSLINEYRFLNPEGKSETIFHMDWYRIDSVSEAIDAGIQDALDSGHYCFIEWPEKASELLPHNCIRLNILTRSPEKREITIVAAGI